MMFTVISSRFPINGVVYLGAAPKPAGIGNVDHKRGAVQEQGVTASLRHLRSKWLARSVSIVHVS